MACAMYVPAADVCSECGFVVKWPMVLPRWSFRADVAVGSSTTTPHAACLLLPPIPVCTRQFLCNTATVIQFVINAYSFITTIVISLTSACATII